MQAYEVTMHVFMTIGQQSSCFHVAAEKSCVTMKSAAGCKLQTGAGPMTLYFIK